MAKTAPCGGWCGGGRGGQDSHAGGSSYYGGMDANTATEDDVRGTDRSCLVGVFEHQA